jgi:peptidoglycan hydrolase CwlO-like protein
MLLQIFALVLLVAVLAVKYATSVHRVQLQQRLSEAANLAQRNHERLKRVHTERQAVEAEVVHTRNQARLYQEHLDALRADLDEAEARQRDLQEQIEKDL